VSQAGIAVERSSAGRVLRRVCRRRALGSAGARRRAEFARRDRWPHNLGLLVLDVGVLRLAARARRSQWPSRRSARLGLVNAFGIPLWIAIPLAVVLLDLAIYFQHVTFHAVRRCGGCTACTIPTSTST